MAPGNKSILVVERDDVYYDRGVLAMMELSKGLFGEWVVGSGQWVWKRERRERERRGRWRWRERVEGGRDRMRN